MKKIPYFFKIILYFVLFCLSGCFTPKKLSHFSFQVSTILEQKEWDFLYKKYPKLTAIAL